ncbi:MAG: PLP-dependent transferase, partial [Rhizomicrobium sp.]
MAEYGFNTLSVHAGAQPDPATGARITPIYQTASYVFENAEQAAARFGLREFGNIYSRLTNPTTSVLEERVAALEGGSAAVAVSSGHAAQFSLLFALLSQGDEFVAATQLYGGSINQFSHTFKQFGWNVKWADGTNPENFKTVITEK